MIVSDVIEKEGKRLCIDDLGCKDSKEGRKRIAEYCEKGGVEAWLTVYRYTPCGSKLQEWAYDNIVTIFNADFNLVAAAALFVCSPRVSENKRLAKRRIVELKDQFESTWKLLCDREAELILWFSVSRKLP